QAIALRFLQTSQNEFPLVTTTVDRDSWSRAILRRGEFPGPGCPERVSGTCARKEGLRILTSPRREASLFKLGRSPRVPANFFIKRAAVTRCRSTEAGGLATRRVIPLCALAVALAGASGAARSDDM